MSLFNKSRFHFLLLVGLLCFNAQAKVTYEGTNGVFNNVFTNNGVQDCTNCHSDSWSKYDASFEAKFDEYSNGNNGASEKTSALTTYLIDNDLMPYTDAAFGSVTPLAQSKIDLLQNWINDSAPQTASPTPTVSDATSKTKTSATINGAVDPSDKAVSSIVFSWGESATYPHGNDEDVSSNYTIAGRGDGQSTNVATSLNSLTCGTTYYYSLLATNANGTDQSPISSFQTSACNQGPTISTTSLADASETNLYQTFIQASDPEDDNFTFSLSGEPTGMTIDPDTGLVAWTPEFGEAGQYNFTVTATDPTADVNGSDVQALTLTVQVTIPPSLTIVNQFHTTELDKFSAAVVISGFDLTDLTLSLQGAPEGMSISNSGLISWQPPAASAGTYNISITATDSSNSFTTEFGLIVALLDDDLDLIADYSDNCVGVNNPLQLNFDLDGLGDDCDLDDDNDGISDELEIAFNLNPLDPSDASLDLDGDGETNITEVLTCAANQDNQCSQLATDSVPPVITVEQASVTASSSGLFTNVALSATAVDVLDGEVSVTLDNVGPYRPGLFNLTWSARDDQGNVSSAEQELRVLPLVKLAGTQVVGEQQTVNVAVHLNGEAPSYPVVIDFEVSGSASEDDTSLRAGSVEISVGTSANISFETFADSTTENDETVEILLTTVSANAQLKDSQQKQTVTIVDRNVAPELVPHVTQGSIESFTIYRDQSVVSVTAQVFDANNDELVVSFEPSEELPQQSIASNVLTFDPQNIEADKVNLLIEVSDGQAVTTNQIQILLVDSMPELSLNIDSDNDGVSDFDEGLSDSDDDKIPDYLDAIDDPSLLSISTASSESLMQVSGGLKLSLGDIAVATQTGEPQVSQQDVVNEAGETVTDDEFFLVGGVYDFEVSGLNDLTRVAQVVIPLSQAIPVNAVYLKFDGEQWVDFVENAENSIASAIKVNGECPIAESELYQAGLIPFGQCVRLTLSDGGPNDADQMVNGIIKDPGGVAVMPEQLRVNFSDNPRQVPIEQPQGSSGSVAWGILVFLTWLVLFRHFKLQTFWLRD